MYFLPKFLLPVICLLIFVAIVCLLIKNKDQSMSVNNLIYKADTLPEKSSSTFSELVRLHITVDENSIRQEEITLPLKLSDANWGLKQQVCKKAGYDLTAFAGQKLLFTSYSIIDSSAETDKKIAWVASKGEKIACVYKTAANTNILPGVYSAK